MRLGTLILLVLLSIATPAFSGVINLRELNTIQLDATPKQVTSTVDGRRMYVLTQDNNLLVYTLGGELQGQLSVDPAIDRITPLGPQHLLLQKTAKKQAVIAIVEVSQPIDISNAPVLGDESAPVTLAVFDDFECPYCAKTVPLLKQVVEKYQGKVKLVFKNFPLTIHRDSRNAALTALAANKQGKFWNVYDLFYANYNSLNPQKIDELAAQTGLDMEQLKKDRLDPRLNAQIESDIAEGTRIGVRGTPTVFVNGRLLQERSMAGFSQLIDEELNRLSSPQKSGQ
ncbi:DsbA family protein [Geopsychrobacter electrodiphilus]|uniref:DsbA family protein n=1 Tax=Geopsychrobacter electrodiphilus TaxID=225196 RepID=UPI00035DD1AA|nr:thioredoxin domain-containing protein [Geopsychrobacter electrodiphilus]